jgi:hypothetical protein
MNIISGNVCNGVQGLTTGGNNGASDPADQDFLEGLIDMIRGLMAKMGNGQSSGSGDAGGAGGSGGAGDAGDAGGAGGSGGAGGASGTGGAGGTDGADDAEGTNDAAGTGTSAQPGTGNLVADGQSMQMSDEGKAMSDFNRNDGTDFQGMEEALKHGDGNTATQDLLNAVQKGELSHADAAAIGAHLQQTTNVFGGGQIDDGLRGELKDALGSDVLSQGLNQTQVEGAELSGVTPNQILNE